MIALAEENLTGDDLILTEAKRRFRQCEDWEGYTRILFDDDLKFANADSDNGYQWPDLLLRERQLERRPCLTINKTRQHNLQIINDAKQNKPGVNIRPVSGGATYKAAQIFEGCVRHIEYISGAENVYDWASTFQVQAGIGYWRIVTDYPNSDTFDQEIYIRRIKDPRSVYLDPDINEIDGSDASFGFVFEDIPNDRFVKEYPKYKHISQVPALGRTADGWLTKDHTRVAEYYRRTHKKDKLITFIDPNSGQQLIGRLSKLSSEEKELWNAVKDEETSKSRPILDPTIEWYKIAGNEIIDRRTWLGVYIPIVRVVGEETVLDGILDRKGHTRAMKDPQRLYNYWSSNSAEFGALQSKSPYVGAVKAIEGLEEYWKTANTKNHSILPFNSVDEDGNQIPPPSRSQPPVMAPGYVQGMQIAQNEMMMASGQYQSQFGQNENATSGKAISERQRQGDNATYHFIDNLSVAIRFTGKILIDLIPKIYDTPRIVRIVGKDGKEKEVNIDPNAQQAFAQQGEEGDDEVSIIFNPTVGQYDVVSDVGPSYATRRQEAFNALTQIAAQNPNFMNIAGDLYFEVSDFPVADKLMERFSRAIPPHILGKGPDPQIQQQLQGMQQQIEQLTNIITKGSKELSDKSDDLDIRRYEAETRRLTALGNSGPSISPEQIQPIVEKILLQMFSETEPKQESGIPLPEGMMQEPQPEPESMQPGIDPGMMMSSGDMQQ